ncbi:hypothetical protein CXG81DRAFT_24642 [Caulochytrium protostelioides]|uniref:Uncharacterized protein n=1 Tax=Caulochytrium protostelioides TaxID=1555241 RepID=A0A4P9XBC5_9FUNG|nr:hypothetical protein CXG81DRAFT_24642 [Caulochytrium protostelioides]|eukprot:RKP02675.1 hypothetical protein CXG81DRAFT_24642 [Caulochytrium protostelioides]
MAPPPSLPAWPWPETRGGAVSRCTRVLRRRGGVLLIVVAVVLLIDRLAWSAIPRMSTSAVASPPSSSPPPPPSRPPLPPPAREADDPVPTLIALRRLLTDVSRSTAAAAAASRRDPGRARAEARQIVDRSVVPALEAFVFHAKRNRAAQQHDAVDRRAHAAIVSAATAPGVAPPDAAAAHIVTAALPPAPPSRLPSVPPSVPPSAVVAPPSPPQRKTASGAGTVGTVARPPKRASDDGVASGDDRDAVRDDDAMAWPGPGLLRSAHDAVDRLESVYVRTHPYRPGARLDTVMQLDADGVPLLRATTGAGRSEAAADGTGGSNVGHVGDDAAAPAADDPDDAVFRLVDSRYNAYVLSQRADPTTMMDDPVLLHDVLRLLLASWVGTIAARALGMPSVCGQLVAGSALGALGAVHSLVQVETVCRGLGNVFFMVLLGAELDAGYPRRRGRWRRAAAALAIAFAGLFVVVAGITRTLHLTSAASEALLITACAVLSSGNLIRSALPHFATAHPVHRWIADLIALQDIALALVVAATPIIAQAGHHAAADAATATSGTSGALPPSSAWHSLAALATTTPSAAHGRLALVLYALRSAVYLLLVLAAAPYVVPAYARLLARWHADEPWRRVPVATGPADAAPALNAPACVRRPALWSFSSASSSSSLASLASLGSAASSASTVDADSMLAGPPDRATDGHNGAAAAVSLARGGSTTAATAHELSILSATGLIAGLALLGAGLGVGSPELAGVLAGAVLRAHAPRPAADPDTSPPTVPGAPGADDAFLPLRSLLGGLFFVTMGLHVPPSFLFHQLGPLAVLAAGMMAAKMAAMATAMHVVHGASAAASAVAVAVAATGAAPPSIDGGRSHSNAHHHGHDKCHGHSNDESNRHGDGDDPLYSAWGVGLTLGHTSEYALILGAHAKQHRWISREIFLLVVGTTVLTLLAWPVVWRVRGAVWQRVRVRRAGKADAPAWATCPATIRRGAWQA